MPEPVGAVDEPGPLEPTALGELGRAFDVGLLPTVEDRAGRPFPSTLGVLPPGTEDAGTADPGVGEFGALDPGAPDGATVTLLVTVSAP